MDHLVEFMHLPLFERAYHIWTQGCYLACRHTRTHAIVLHALEDYFVETWYGVARKDITMVIAFRTTAKLAPFLNKDSLEELLEK